MKRKKNVLIRGHFRMVMDWKQNLKQQLALSLILIINFPGFGFAQSKNELYQTRNGIVNIVFPFEDSTVTMHSNNLIVLLDYNTARAAIELPVSSLHTGIDSLDSILFKMEDSDIKLNAKLGISYINTQDHPPQHFNFEGTLLLDSQEFPINGEGHLEHLIGGESIDCRLGMSFEIDPQIIPFNSKMYSVNPNQTVKITIVQSVLDKLK